MRVAALLFAAIAVAIVVASCGSEPDLAPTETPDISATVSAAIADALGTPILPSTVSPTATPTPKSARSATRESGRVPDTEATIAEAVAAHVVQTAEARDPNSLEFWAIESPENVSQRLDRQPDAINAKGLHGETPLHVAAARNPNYEVVKHLLGRGADIEAMDYSGRTVLHYALDQVGSAPVLIELLLDHGVNIAVKNSSGETACDIVERRYPKQILFVEPISEERWAQYNALLERRDVLLNLVCREVSPAPTATVALNHPIMQWSEPPSQVIDLSASYTVVLQTSAGSITVEMFTEEAPNTVNNFVFLAGQGFYDNVIFHRTIEGFMIQGGDPTGTGGGGPGYTFADEPVQRSYSRGIVAMANAGPDTNGSQFFIIHADYSLPPSYTIFGQVVAGLETVDAIATAPTSPEGEVSTPLNPVVIQSVEIISAP